MAESKAGRTGLILTTLAVLGGIVTVTGGTAGLVFLAKPDWRPCLGGAHASFTAAPVVPHVSYREHLIREGEAYQEAQNRRDFPGAEVRFTFESDGYKDELLVITWSLFEVNAAGELLRVVPGQDRALAMDVTPKRCGDKGGDDLFVPVPPGASRRYQVLLELFHGAPPSDRIDLTQTNVFRG